MDTHRKHWNQQQQALRRALAPRGLHQQAIALFMEQHAMVHAANMSKSGLWSFEDEAVHDLAPDEMRQVLENGEHSIVWILWHLARTEDVTMNLLVAGSPQVLNQREFAERIGASIRHLGNIMDRDAVAAFSATIDIAVLRAYRAAVGLRTQEIVQQLEASVLRQKVDPERLQRVKDEGGVIPEAHEIIAYWGGRTIAGLLLMPPTRHCFLHLNEALRCAQALKRQRRKG